MRPRICVYRAADRAFRLDWNRYYEKQTIGGFAQLGRTVVSFQWRRPLTDAEKVAAVAARVGVTMTISFLDAKQRASGEERTEEQI